ncbi:Protease 3 precursor [Pseudobythopirellula maris]|uniref:Protease 3 n=1 Tax=Pseudobythopirellula maris TaxID=2527991 RepID=A0A5C5ZT51_9BACT|nr:pitrilysin family protein [Pseudobythopirellula maris]TWT89981.1 Protease 3 precursor [Pseudobythopirellula maris]
MDFRRHTLANGLEVVAECTDDAHSLAAGVFVRAGSRDETDEVAGVSHFLEHMAFKGTPRRSADDVNREFDEIGAHYNAYTSEENTVYYASILPEHQGEAVDLLTDIARPSLRSEDFEMEKNVILEEIEMYMDQPPYGMDDRVKELAFAGHPISRSVLGTAETIRALTPDQMRGYFERRYSPTNLVLAATGKVDFDALVEQAERQCGGWEKVDAPRRTEGAATHARFESVVKSAATQQYALLLGGAPAGDAADRYAAKLLATIVGDDSGSRMYWDLVDPGLAESCSLGHYDYQGLGMNFTWLGCEPEDLEENLARVRAIFETVDADSVSDDELELAKTKVKSRVVLSSERPRSRLFNVGGGWLMRGDYLSTQDDLEGVDRVTQADIRRVLDAFPLSRHATVTVGPREIAAP